MKIRALRPMYKLPAEIEFRKKSIDLKDKKVEYSQLFCYDYFFNSYDK